MASVWKLLRGKATPGAISLLLGPALTGCGFDGKQEKAKSPSPATVSTGLVFQVKGVVQELKPDGKTIVIQHEKIPNYMPAMTMPLAVKDTNELAKIKAGDVVSFRMHVQADDGWIDQVTIVGQTNAPHASASFRRVREVDPLKVGDMMPDYRFTNELAQAVNLKDFRGQAYAFTFIFTRCPFPTFCPRMSSQFSEVRQKLLARPGGPDNWHLFTITFDPEYDSPDRLKDYASRYEYDPKRWNYLTGAMIDIDAITEQFGLAFSWRAGSIDHTLRTVVVDAAGKVQKVFIGNEWKADDLAAELIMAATVVP